MQTLNQIIKKFKDYSDAHILIKRFEQRNFSEVTTDKEAVYPLMFVELNESRATEQTLELSFTILFGDQESHDKSNRLEIQSDCLSLCNDLYSYILQSQETEDWVVKGDVIMNPFSLKFNNQISGYYMKITIEIARSVCDIPLIPELDGSGVNRCADFIPNIEPSSASICAGIPNIIRLNSPTPGVTYSWYFGGTLVYTGVEFVSMGDIADAGTYTIIASNSEGCTTELVHELVYLPIASWFAITLVPESSPGALDGFIEIEFDDANVYNYDFEVVITDALTGGSLYTSTLQNSKQFFNLANDRYTIKASVINPITQETACGYTNEVVLS